LNLTLNESSHETWNSIFEVKREKLQLASLRSHQERMIDLIFQFLLNEVL